MKSKKISTRFLSFAEVREITGLSRSSIHKAEKAGMFPKRRLLSECRVGWLESEVEAWMTNRKPVSDSVQPKHNIPPRKTQRPVGSVGQSPEPEDPQEPGTPAKSRQVPWWDRPGGD